MARHHLYTMAIKAVNNWLNGERNYTKGAQLYKQYGSSNVLADLFAKSQNTYTERKLLEELQKLNASNAPQPVEVAAIKPKARKKDLMRLAAFKRKKPPTFTPADLTNAPKSLQNLEQRRRQLFQQAAEVKAALSAGEFKTPEERYKAVKLIDANFYGHRGIQQIWQRIDFWQQHGRFIPFHASKPTKPVNREALHKRLTTVRTYVSRYKDKPDKYELHEKYMQELMDIEQQLMDNGTI
jgi:hypothetical protein